MYSVAFNKIYIGLSGWGHSRPVRTLCGATEVERPCARNGTIPKAVTPHSATEVERPCARNGTIPKAVTPHSACYWLAQSRVHVAKCYKSGDGQSDEGLD